MANLSKVKRERMLAFLETLKIAIMQMKQLEHLMKLKIILRIKNMDWYGKLMRNRLMNS